MSLAAASLADPVDAAYGWHRAGRPFPLTRLYQDVMCAYYEALRICFEATGSPMAREHILRIVDGWSYVRAPSVDENEVEERLQRHVARAQRFTQRGSHYYFDELRPELVETIGRLSRHPRSNAKLGTLVEHLSECIGAEARIMGDLHWRMAGATLAGKPFDWPAVYNEITGRPEAEATVFLGGLDNELTKTIRALQRLARIAQEDPELLKAVEAKDVQELDRDQPAFRRFRSAFRRMLRAYGFRAGHGWGSAIELDSPTWRMCPEIPLGMIATYARADLDTIHRKETAAARERRQLMRDVRRGLRHDLELARRFEEALSRAKTMARVIEDHNHWMDQSAPGVLREAADLVGRRLVRDGVIDAADDVLHVSLDELRALANGETLELAPLITDRKRKHADRLANPAPETIGAGSGPSKFQERISSLTAEGDGLVGEKLHGVAASAGRYKGRARVCGPSPYPPDLDDGDILVCVDAGPSWTPVFAVLGAMVLDKGATFQHAAVIAREFGIPAVLGTKDGTTTITEGQIITVDGDEGVVEL